MLRDQTYDSNLRASPPVDQDVLMMYECMGSAREDPFLSDVRSLLDEINLRKRQTAPPPSQTRTLNADLCNGTGSGLFDNLHGHGHPDGGTCRTRIDRPKQGPLPEDNVRYNSHSIISYPTSVSRVTKSTKYSIAKERAYARHLGFKGFVGFLIAHGLNYRIEKDLTYGRDLLTTIRLLEEWK